MPDIAGAVMARQRLAAVAELAGYRLSEPDLERVASLLDGMVEDIQRLRDVPLPDELEPVLGFRLEPWTEP